MTNATARLLEQAMDETPDEPVSMDAAHVACGLTMVGTDGPVPCSCHRYCDPRLCLQSALEAGFAGFGS